MSLCSRTGKGRNVEVSPGQAITVGSEREGCSHWGVGLWPTQHVGAPAGKEGGHVRGRAAREDGLHTGALST